MPGNVLDRRVQKTRKLLQDALVELISEKGFETVTIQEIIDKANVGRSTFYSHFQDKSELLHSCFSELGQLLERFESQLLEGNQNNRDNIHSDLILKMFQFVGRNHRLFKALLSKGGIAVFTPAIYSKLVVYLQSALKRSKLSGHQTPLQTEMISHYFVSAFIGIVRWWVEKDIPCTAEEMDKLFKQLSMTGYGEVLGWSLDK
jgi:AcrR family transcriptional regulator